ncbi:XRE family transcriptional regulator [Aminobacterium colombiense]|uniref:Transcriptional regulator, XRE family n=1 Tax=Aminobacterium colombiense (strain DSM 12261 / ALA-1) TaxID=572547 RepID=D5EFD3_AMICL|nr:LexA family transcriptional regulator [Aminobacterium colombiense]ADE57265.1 transcriptional regulator, XRE family [Aminobacterium colombiense DSM 12261]
MISGEEIRRLRKAKGWTQQQLADNVGVAKTTIVDWEKDRYFPTGENVHKLSRSLEVSIAYLMGETDNPIQIGKDNIFKDYDLIPVALISPEQTACCGAGMIDMDTTCEPEKILVLSRREIGEYDPNRPPYAIHTDGVSMEGFGIPSGSVVFINPREHLESFDVCLICYYGRLAIKKVIFKPNGNFEIFSDSEDDNREISKEEFDSGLFEIRGKVIAIHSTPGHGRF